VAVAVSLAAWSGGRAPGGDVCELPIEFGPCDGVCPRWFFNPETSLCEEFTYGCCGGNANNFLTLLTCQSTCACGLPPDPGPCDGAFPRWFFNSESGECEEFTYGGCEGNANNFETLEACETACDNPCQADVNLDGKVNVQDMIEVIVSWGLTGGPADVNDDGAVNVQDLVAVVVGWGPCG
jgi:hypothetical protein